MASVSGHRTNSEGTTRFLGRPVNRSFRSTIPVLYLVIMIASLPLQAFGTVQSELRGIPPGSAPVPVRMGFNLINITDVDEKEETMDFEGALYLEWRDDRLAFGVDSSASGAGSRIYQGEYQVKELFRGWRPHVVIPNGIGDREATNMAIRIWADGRVQYSETFYAKVETPMDLRRFPFDTQLLEIYFHVFVYQRDELLLMPEQELATSWGRNVGIAEWIQKSISVREEAEPIAYFDAVEGLVSSVVATVEIKRRPTHVVITIILPMVLLVALTWCVFWMDAETLSNRVSVTFIGILSVVTYYFVVFESLPEIDYLTFMDAFILATFLILAAGVVVSVLIETTTHEEGRETDPRINRLCPWAFPLTYVLVTCVLGFVFFLLI